MAVSRLSLAQALVQGQVLALVLVLGLVPKLVLVLKLASAAEMVVVGAVVEVVVKAVVVVGRGLEQEGGRSSTGWLPREDGDVPLLPHA